MTRLHPRADFLNCSFSNNRSGGEDERGDAIYHWNEIGFFNDPLQLCSLVNCAFWGTNGLDVQIYSDPHGFSSVSFCAFGVGEYYCIGVEPTSTVTLTQSPYVSTLDLHLYSESPCIDQGLDLGPNADIEGILVPQGLTTDIGAHEYLDPSGVTSSPPSAFMLKAFPNPFNPRTTIQFELLQPAETVRLAVYDPGGRFVALLSEGPREAGRHLITWEGRNEEGRTVPAGLYLARLDAGNLSRTIKILLVR